MTDTPDYSEFREEPTGDLLQRISEAAAEQKKAELRVARLEEELAQAKEELKDVAEHRLPALMDEAEIEDFTTKDGIKIGVKEKIRGSIPAANRPQALKWLEDNGFENLIKREFKIQFNKDEESWARKFQADLAKRKKPLKVQVDRNVNPSTLQSFVKQRLEEGEEIPMKLFGVFRQRMSKIDTKG